MKAILMRRTGGPEVLEAAELPVPVPGQGQALVRVAAIGVNYIEIYVREGRYPAELPAIPGSEIAGVIEAVGPGVTGFAPGDPVASFAALGGYAEYALVPAAQLVRMPAGLAAETAAAAMVQGLTAHALSHSCWPLKPGDSCLLHAAAGGVGLLLTQMAAKLGARVIATASTEEKLALARAAGAAETICYTRQDFVAETRRLTEGRGVDVVYDSVGKTTFEGSLDCLRPRGLLALFGASSGAVPPLDPLRLAGKGSLYLTRPAMFDYARTREELEWRAGEVLGGVLAGTLKLRIHRRYPLAEAARAQADLAARQTTGKLLLIP